MYAMSCSSSYQRYQCERKDVKSGLAGPVDGKAVGEKIVGENAACGKAVGEKVASRKVVILRDMGGV